MDIRGQLSGVSFVQYIKRKVCHHSTGLTNFDFPLPFHWLAKYFSNKSILIPAGIFCRSLGWKVDESRSLAFDARVEGLTPARSPLLPFLFLCGREDSKTMEVAGSRGQD